MRQRYPEHGIGQLIADRRAGIIQDSGNDFTAGDDLPHCRRHPAVIGFAVRVQREHLFFAVQFSCLCQRDDVAHAQVSQTGTAVQQVQKLRREEQLPVAQKIDDMIRDIQKANPNTLVSLLNYCQLTATAFFTDVTRLLEIKEF